MSANRRRPLARHHHSPSGRSHRSWLGVTAALMALLGTLGLIYLNQVSTPEAFDPIKLAGYPRAATPTLTETAVVVDMEPLAPLTGLPAEGPLVHAWFRSGR